MLTTCEVCGHMANSDTDILKNSVSLIEVNQSETEEQGKQTNNGTEFREGWKGVKSAHP